MEATGTFHNRLLRWRAPPQTAEQRTTKIENVITFHSRKCFHSRFEIVRCFIGRQPSSVTYLIQGSSSHLTSECYRCPANRLSILNSIPSQPTVHTSQTLFIRAAGTRKLPIELWLRNCNCSSVPTFFFVLSGFHWRDYRSTTSPASSDEVLPWRLSAFRLNFQRLVRGFRSELHV